MLPIDVYSSIEKMSNKKKKGWVVIAEENSLFLVAFQLVIRVNRYPRNTWLSTRERSGYPIISGHVAFSRGIWNLNMIHPRLLCFDPPSGPVLPLLFPTDSLHKLYIYKYIRDILFLERRSYCNFTKSEFTIVTTRDQWCYHYVCSLATYSYLKHKYSFNSITFSVLTYFLKEIFLISRVYGFNTNILRKKCFLSCTYGYLRNG